MLNRTRSAQGETVSLQGISSTATSYQEAAQQLRERIEQVAQIEQIKEAGARADGFLTFGRGRLAQSCVQVRRLRRGIFATSSHQKEKLAAKINRLLVNNFYLMNAFKRAISDLGVLDRSFTMSFPSFRALIDGQDIGMRSYKKVSPEEICEIYRNALERLCSFAINQYKNASGRSEYSYNVTIPQIQGLSGSVFVTVHKTA